MGVTKIHYPGTRRFSSEYQDTKTARTTQAADRTRATANGGKQQVVEAREFEDIRLVKEHVAEFRYRPTNCKRDYRVVVVWKDLEVHKGQLPVPRATLKSNVRTLTDTALIIGRSLPPPSLRREKSFTFAEGTP
jgi:hypothetical protein